MFFAHPQVYKSRTICCGAALSYVFLILLLKACNAMAFLPHACQRFHTTQARTVLYKSSTIYCGAALSCGFWYVNLRPVKQLLSFTMPASVLQLTKLYFKKKTRAHKQQEQPQQ
jgi:hypothetical protein